MANTLIKNGAGDTKYLKSTGAGTDGDPHIPQHLETNSTAILAAVDGLEALLTTIDADTSTLAAAVATEMQVDVVSSALPTGAATAANQTTLIGHVDGIEALLTTIDADTSTLAAAVSTEMQVDVVGALPAGDNNIGNIDVASIAAGETHIGEVHTNSDVIAVTLSLDTAAYATGDVLAATQEVANLFRIANGRAMLQSIVLNDKDDQGQALDLVFLSANVSIGSENAAVSIADNDADSVLGIISIAALDWIDLGGTRVATKTGIGLMLESVTDSTSGYIAAISRGAGTYSASGITLRLGVARD